MLRSDPKRSLERRAALERYYREHVLAPGDGLVCAHAASCRASVARARRPRDVWEGQLSHVGSRYELEEDGRPLRILVVAMESGHPPAHVSMEARSRGIGRSADRGFRSRNPHMKGTTSALRVLLGGAPGDDEAGERLPDGGHVFDAHAMVNLRLCSATAVGTMSSRPTTTMSRNCARHLASAIRILEPTICVTQGGELRRWLDPLLSERRPAGERLETATLGHVRSTWVWLVHPSAQTQALTWGRLTNAPYLDDVVVPTLRRARELAR